MKNKKQGNNSSKYKDGHVVALLVLSLVFLFLLTQLPVLEWGGFATKPVDLFSDIRVDEQDLDLPGDAEWQEEGTEWLNEGGDSLSSVEKDEPQNRQVVPDTIRVQETADTLLVSRPIYSRKTCEVCCNPGMVGVVWDTCLCIPIFPDFVGRSYSRAKVGKCIVY